METHTRPRAASAATKSGLRLIASGDLTFPGVITETLNNLLEAEDYSDCVKNLQKIDIDQQSYINGLDKVRLCFVLSLAASRSWPSGSQAIDILSPGSGIYERCVRALSRACGIYGLLPNSHEVESALTTSEHAVKSGGFSDIWRGEDANGDVFAIKVLRMYEDNAPELKKVGEQASFPFPHRRLLTGCSFGIPEILQRGYHIQANEPPERLAD